MEDESLSPHRYIRFDVTGGGVHRRNTTKKHWAYRKLDYPGLVGKLRKGAPPPPDDAAAACEDITTWLAEA